MKLVTNQKVNNLLDNYEVLLTKSQSEIMELYYREDWSLQEIADKLKVSRNSVHITIKRVLKMLEEYEAKLGLTKKDEALNHLLNDKKLSPTQKLKAISKIINE
jgi:predicted DNA-binding protein YlxM (UPF0122 family)